MAEFAAGRETRDRVVRVRGRLVLAQVTIHALVRRTGETRGVAFGAVQLLVSPGQGERRVVETRTGPCRGDMTAVAALDPTVRHVIG